MPTYRKLTQEDLAAMTMPPSGERARIREEYRGYLSDLELGEGGELTLDSDEKKVTVKNRLKRAAKDLGVGIEFRRSGENLVRYSTKTLEEAAPKRRRGGRRKADQ